MDKPIGGTFSKAIRDSKPLIPECGIKPIIPAKEVELIDVARAMHRDQFSKRLNRLFEPERQAALEAIQSGIYIGWRIPQSDNDCIRVSIDSLCFCGHALNQHEKFDDRRIRRNTNLKCLASGCKCKQYAFVPSRPDEIGEWWLHKRRGFDVSSWRALCRCKHSHEQHDPNLNRRCKRCACFSFSSGFLCSACNRHWEHHGTFFDDITSRQEQGLPVGEEFLPFYELPTLRNIVLTGSEDDNSTFEAIQNGPNAIPRQQPTQLALQLQGETPNPDYNFQDSNGPRYM